VASVGVDGIRPISDDKYLFLYRATSFTVLRYDPDGFGFIYIITTFGNLFFFDSIRGGMFAIPSPSLPANFRARRQSIHIDIMRVYLKRVVDAVHSQSFPLVALQPPDVLVFAAGLALLPVPGPGRPAAVPALSVRSGTRVVADLP